MIMYLSGYFFYKKISKKNFNLKKIKFEKNFFKYSNLILILLIVNYIILVLGKINYFPEITFIKYQAIFSSIIPLRELVYIYICLYREENKNIYKLIIIFFIFLYLLQGWTGHILIIVLLEFFYNKKIKIKFRYIFLIPFLLKILQALVNFKFFIRNGYSPNYNLFQTTQALIDRFNFFNSICLLYEKINTIPFEIYEKIIKFEYFRQSLLALVPSPNLLRIKELRVFSRYFVQLVYPGVESHSDIGLLGSVVLYFHFNKREALVYVVYIVFLLLFLKFLFDKFQNRNIYNLYFIYLWFLIQSGNIRILVLLIYSTILVCIINFIFNKFKRHKIFYLGEKNE